MKKPALKVPGSVGKYFDPIKNSLKPIKERLPKKPLYLWLLISALVLAIISGAFYFFLSPDLRQKTLKTLKLKPAPDQQPTPTLKPIRPLAPGKQTYTISGGKKGAPQITEAVIDPLDVKKNQNQTFTVKASDEKEIVEIKAVVEDNGQF